MAYAFSASAAAVLVAVAEALTPAPEIPISHWVDQGHVILTAKTNTPKEGPFAFDGVEYLREPLDRLHPDDPCTRVTIKGSAQSGKSSVGQLWVAWSVDVNPKSFAIGLPSSGEVLKYNELKLQPILEDSPRLKPKVRPVSTKSGEGSTARKKRLFNGASLLIFNLGSANELQMISTGNLILEEVAQTKVEVGTRGAPVKQARERQKAYSVIGSKELMVSTPGEVGTCEVTKAFELGDQRRYYGECPHCSGFFVLLPENFVLAKDGQPHHFVCPGCGCLLEEHQRASFRRNGDWLPCFSSDDTENPAPPDYVAKADFQRWRNRNTEGREPSYYIWQVYCGLISWDAVAGTIREAKAPDEIKALEQQVYGRAYDPSIEAMEWTELHKLREPYDHGTVPAAAGVLTGMCDVQGDYLQWSVIGWGPGAEWWIVDRGIIQGDTSASDVWHALDGVTRKQYPHALGGVLPIAAFGVDTGYRTQRAYSFCRGRPNCYALDGRPDWKTPHIGKPKPVRVVENGRVRGRVRLWPTGTWQLKSLLAWSLKRSTEATYMTALEGRGHWSMAEDENWCQQITAEVLCEEKNAKTAQTDRWFKKVRANEELDIWVGSRALAWMLGVGAPRGDGLAGDKFDWAGAADERKGTAQSDLFVRPAPPPVPNVAPAVSAHPSPQKTKRKWYPD